MQPVITFLALLISVHCVGQQPLKGEIDYPQLGMSFTVPEGWVANEADGIIFIGSETISGLILMSIHEHASMEEVRASLDKGFSEDGIELFPNGPAYDLREHASAMDYTGKIEGEPAKGIGITMLNPFGNGVSIVALALEKVYSEQLRSAAISIMESMAFRKVEADNGPSLEQWQRHLMNVRLTRIEDDTSNAERSFTEQRIDLCEDGFQIWQPDQNGQVEVPANGTSLVSGSGKWNVLLSPQGKPVLRLEHKDGKRSEFLLTEEEGRIYLNGKRWFRTAEGDHAPDCR